MVDTRFLSVGIRDNQRGLVADLVRVNQGGDQNDPVVVDQNWIRQFNLMFSLVYIQVVTYRHSYNRLVHTYISLLCQLTQPRCGLYGGLLPEKKSGLRDLTDSGASPGFPGGSVVKESACKAGDAGAMGSLPGSGRSLGGDNGNPLFPGESHVQRSLVAESWT